MCGDASYDPAAKFCVLGKLYDKCDGKTYAISSQACVNGVVVSKCAEYKELKNGNFEYVTTRAVKDGEFCWNGIVTPKCGGKEFGQDQFCGLAFDGKTDSVYTYCKTQLEALEEAYEEFGVVLKSSSSAASSSAQQVVEEDESLFGNLIGETPVKFDVNDLKTFYTSLKTIQTICTEGSAKAKWCGSKTYIDTEKFCDIRDNHIYKYVKIEGADIWWMNENLAFEYKLPMAKIDKINETAK